MLSKINLFMYRILYAPTTEIGKEVDAVWQEIYKVIKEVGGTLAIATFVCSAFYFFILGRNKNSLETAKSVMIGSGVGIAIIYFAPTIINTVLKIVQ